MNGGGNGVGYGGGGCGGAGSSSSSGGNGVGNMPRRGGKLLWVSMRQGWVRIVEVGHG